MKETSLDVDKKCNGIFFLRHNSASLEWRIAEVQRNTETSLRGCLVVFTIFVP